MKALTAAAVAASVALLVSAMTAGASTHALASACSSPGCVTTADLAPGAVTGPKIAAGAISNANIGATAAIAGSKLAHASVTGGKIADGSITGANLGIGSVGTSNIAAGAVTGGKLSANSVVSANIVDGSVSSSDLSSSFSVSGSVGAGSFATSHVTVGSDVAVTGNLSHLTAAPATGQEPTGAAGPGASFGATCDTASGSSDTRGTVELTTTGGNETVGAVCTITFKTPFGSVPYVVISPASANVMNLPQMYVTTTTATFVLNSAGNQIFASETYDWNYMVVG